MRAPRRSGWRPDLSAYPDRSIDVRVLPSLGEGGIPDCNRTKSSACVEFAFASRMKKILFILCAIFAASVAAFLIVQLIVVGGTRASIFSADDVASAYVVIVPGASVLRNGTPSDILADRLTVAANIYAAGKAEKILVSGDNGQDGYDEVNVMRRFLLDKDVAPEDIFLDHAGFDTYDTMYRARHVFGITDAIVVTQRYHLYRALFVASHLGINAKGVASDLQPYVKQVWFSTRETLSRVKAAKDVLTGSTSEYLGDPIDIRGNGRVTWDQDISSP